MFLRIRILAILTLLTFTSNAHALRVAMLHDSFGERESTVRLSLAAKKMGWEAKVWQASSETFDAKEITEFAPDFVITTKTTIPNFSSIPNYLVLYMPYGFHAHECKVGKLDDLSSFTGLLVTSPQKARFKRLLAKLNSNFAPFSWYPTVHKRELVIAEQKTLFYCGANWDDTRKSKRYQELFDLLDRCGYLRVYGSEKAWSHLPRSYGGFIPSDGESLLQEMSRHGIALILHEMSFNREGVTSARVFEAASSGCVMISDRNRFIEKEFGGCTLFIDEGFSAAEIFNQIDTHMKWIKTHPEEAKAMVKRSQEILEEKFLVEEQLLQLEKWHISLNR